MPCSADHSQVSYSGKTQSVNLTASLMHMSAINQCVTALGDHIWSVVFQCDMLEDDLSLLKTERVVDLSPKCAAVSHLGLYCNVLLAVHSLNL